MILDHFENVNLCAHEIAVLNAKYYTVTRGVALASPEHLPVTEYDHCYQSSQVEETK